MSEKAQGGFFSSGEQKLLVEVYEEQKHIITGYGLIPSCPRFNPQANSNLGRIAGELKLLFMPCIFHFFEKIGLVNAARKNILNCLTKVLISTEQWSWQRQNNMDPG